MSSLSLLFTYVVSSAADYASTVNVQCIKTIKEQT